MSTVKVTDSTFQDEVLASDVPVVVDFHGAGIDIGLERVKGVREIGDRIGHGIFPPIRERVNQEKQAAASGAPPSYRVRITNSSGRGNRLQRGWHRQGGSSR